MHQDWVRLPVWKSTVRGQPSDDDHTAWREEKEFIGTLASERDKVAGPIVRRWDPESGTSAKQKVANRRGCKNPTPKTELIPPPYHPKTGKINFTDYVWHMMTKPCRNSRAVQIARQDKLWLSSLQTLSGILRWPHATVGTSQCARQMPSSASIS